MFTNCSNMGQSLLFLTHCPVAPSPIRRGRGRRFEVLASRSAPLKQDVPTKLLLAGRRGVSQSAMDAIVDVYTNANAAVHSGSCAHELGRRAAERMEKARADVAHAIGADDWREIWFASSSFAATSTLAQSVGCILRKGDEVIMCAAACDPSTLSWRIAARQRGFGLAFAKADADADEPLQFVNVAAHMCSSTKLVVMQHLSPRTCAFAPVGEIVDFAASVNVPVFLDATYSLPWTNINVKELGCDYLVASGEALGAPPGSAFVYGRRKLLERLPPVQGGENAYENVPIRGVTTKKLKQAGNWAPVPERFEAGMPCLANAAALAIALRDHVGTMNSSSSNVSTKLAWHLYTELGSCPRVTVLGSNEEERVPAACFRVQGLPARTVAESLKERGVAIDMSCWNCATEERGDENLCVSFDPLTHTVSDVSMFAGLLSEILGVASV